MSDVSVTGVSNIFRYGLTRGKHLDYRLSENRPPKGGSAMGTHFPLCVL